MDMRIDSTRNEKVKRARSLANRKGRAEQGLHFIEGEKMCIRDSRRGEQWLPYYPPVQGCFHGAFGL